jgi:hypothetical protein
VPLMGDSMRRLRFRPVSLTRRLRLALSTIWQSSHLLLSPLSMLCGDLDGNVLPLMLPPRSLSLTGSNRITSSMISPSLVAPLLFLAVHCPRPLSTLAAALGRRPRWVCFSSRTCYVSGVGPRALWDVQCRATSSASFAVLAMTLMVLRAPSSTRLTQPSFPQLPTSRPSTAASGAFCLVAMPSICSALPRQLPSFAWALSDLRLAFPARSAFRALMALRIPLPLFISRLLPELPPSTGSWIGAQSHPRSLPFLSPRHCRRCPHLLPLCLLMLSRHRGGARFRAHVGAAVAASLLCLRQWSMFASLTLAMPSLVLMMAWLWLRSVSPCAPIASTFVLMRA